MAGEISETTPPSEAEPIAAITVILPGYSLRNRDWARQMEDAVESMADGNNLFVHGWKHWAMLEAQSKAKAEAELMGLTELGPELLATIPHIPFIPAQEADEVIKETGDEPKINVIAKSVGTSVAMSLLAKIPERINKVILCGIPGVDKRNQKFFRDSIGDFPIDRILCIQNERDYVVGYEKAKKFLNKVNPMIQIVKKPRADHKYPYPQDFYNFLKGK